DLDQGEIALAVFGGADFAFDGVARVQVEAPDLRRRDVDVVGAGQVRGFGGTQKSETVGQYFQHAVAENLLALLGPPFHDGEHELLLAQAVGVFDFQAGGHFQQLRDVQRLQFIKVHRGERGISEKGFGGGPRTGPRGIWAPAVPAHGIHVVYNAPSRKAVSCDFDSAPTLVAAAWPFLNSIRVGMPRMPYLAAVSWFSSTLSLATVRRPAYSAATSSRMGAIILHGPHQAAQ